MTIIAHLPVTFWCGYLPQLFNFHFDRESVRLMLKHLDPDGVEKRTRRRLKRRDYFNKVSSYRVHSMIFLVE